MSFVFRFYTEKTLDEQVDYLREKVEAGKNGYIPNHRNLFSEDPPGNPFYYVRITPREVQLMQGCANTSPSYVARGGRWEDIEQAVREKLIYEKKAVAKSIDALCSQGHPWRDKVGIE